MEHGPKGRLAHDAKVDWSDQNDLQSLHELIGKMRRGEIDSAPPAPVYAPPNPKKGWFDFTINVQLLIAGLIGLVMAMAGWGFNTILSYSSFQTTVTEFRSTTQAQLSAQNQQIQSINDQLNVMRQSVLQVRDQINTWQTQSAMHNSDQDKMLAALDKSLSVLQERIDERLKPAAGPHGALEKPEKFGLLDSVPYTPITGGR